MIIVGFVLVAAVAGVMWEAWWTPPVGLALRGTWVLIPSGPDLAFAGAARYAVVAAPLGFVLGLCCGLLRGREAWTLAAVIVGSVAAAFVMFAVGHALGPPDPYVLSAAEEDFTEVPGHLVLSSEPDQPVWWSTAMLAFPGGALSALAMVLLVGTAPSSTTDS